MAFKLPQIYLHPVDGSTLIPILKSRLPDPIAPYRRLQQPHRSPSSYVLATFPTNIADSLVPQCFCIAFLDRSRRPEVESWIFLSGQADSTKTCPPSTSGRCGGCTAALLAMLRQFANVPLPESVHAGEPNLDLAGSETPLSDFDRHVLDPNCMLIASLAQLPFDILHEHGIIRTDLPHGPYQKFIIRTASLGTFDTALPPGLIWGEVRPQDFPLIRSRTGIPRKDKTLALLPSVAIFPSGAPGTVAGSPSPVAWAFVGLDGALMSLHTEPEYRGQGLAKKLTAKLLNEKLRSLDESEGDQEGGWWGHSDVSPTNKESQGVAKGLGGTEGWLNYWVRVDLGKVKGLGDREE